jgi:hypothetical protein
LLRAGVDINTIRARLGHVSLATTNVYAEVDLEMKAKALANCEVKEQKPKKSWREDQGLTEFLKSLWSDLAHLPRPLAEPRCRETPMATPARCSVRFGGCPAQLRLSDFQLMAALVDDKARVS